jgi:hypothetical protein
MAKCEEKLVLKLQKMFSAPHDRMCRIAGNML